jgi:hypothetical protein|tara:strand:- start:55 stop:192 length:138 start_codon:yes stop_codon:yes gene_type:complete
MLAGVAPSGWCFSAGFPFTDVVLAVDRFERARGAVGILSAAAGAS